MCDYRFENFYYNIVSNYILLIKYINYLQLSKPVKGLIKKKTTSFILNSTSVFQC